MNITLPIKAIKWSLATLIQLWLRKPLHKKVLFFLGLLPVFFMSYFFSLSKQFSEDSSYLFENNFFFVGLLFYNAFFSTIIQLLSNHNPPIIPFKSYWPITRTIKLILLLSFNLFDELFLYLLTVASLFKYFDLLDWYRFWTSILMLLIGSFICLSVRFIILNSTKSKNSIALFFFTLFNVAQFVTLLYFKEAWPKFIVFIEISVLLFFVILFYFLSTSDFFLTHKGSQKKYRFLNELRFFPRVSLKILFSEVTSHRLKYYFVIKILLVCFLLFPKFENVQQFFKFMAVMPIAFFSSYFGNYNNFNQNIWKYFKRTGKEPVFFHFYLYSILPVATFDLFYSSVIVILTQRLDFVWFVFSWLSVFPIFLALGWITSLYFPKPVPEIQSHNFSEQQLVSLHFAWVSILFTLIAFYFYSKMQSWGLALLFVIGFSLVHFVSKAGSKSMH